ncbi:SNF2 family N-terminal domain-containing protein [Paraphoma chrysanthemicola]|uniref:SNF2 family N-terminal domain-containing protein n=1 Tax=Paraphoma chrysanthemicola TaxID=798071 RepID=A0A8K0R591_9PLEO|nr:SNF2 family N-terminal domain-containing protein [Paraphoma chrysanthemicola]
MDPYAGQSEAEIRNSIDMLTQFLNGCSPTHADAAYYRSLLDGMRAQLAGLQNAGSSWMAANTQPSPYIMTPSNGDTSPSSVELPVPRSRKRSLGPADGPEPKRISANPSPLTPGTPDSLFDAPITEQQQQWSLPNRSAEHSRSSGGAFGAHAYPIVDLTISDPPSPEPFPEVVNAFRDDGARPEPRDAFIQETMGEQELAEFLLAPTPANGGYAFQQQRQQGSAQPPSVAPQQQLALPVDFPPRRPVPYLPGPQRPDWLGGDSDDEEYGHFPLSATEAESIEAMLESIGQHGDENAIDGREQTPRTMQSQLMEYQKIGLTWLMKKENGPSKGGILADEMGLGKTVQALALVCARPSTDELCKTTLVIAPVALMRQWEKEISHHVYDHHKLKTYVYWGNGKSANFEKLKRYDVVLTTFGILTSEFKQKESRRESMLYEREMNDPNFRRSGRDTLALLGPRCMWYRIIIDEAHNIKNRNAISSKAAADLQARYRLCLTGTPMMNSIDELFPLLRFLKVDRYSDWTRFSQDIAKPAKNQHPETREKAMQRVQILLKTIMLRRQKTSIVDGKPILNLPPKHTMLDNVEFSDDELAVYKALETKSQIQLNKFIKQGSVSANYACILVLLLRLRQACCHPHLIKDLSQPATEGIAEDDLLERARYLADDVVKRLEAFDSFECPICFEADPNPTIIVPCGHTACGACIQKLIDPARPGREADEANNPRCPTCRGDLKAKLITDYKHFCRVHCPERLDAEDRVEVEENVDSDSEAEEIDDDDGDDVDDKGNLAGFVVSDEEDDAFEAEDEDAGSASGRSVRPTPKKAKKKSKGKGKARVGPKKTLAQLKKESLRNKAAKKKYLRRLEKTYVPSAKIDQTIEILHRIRNNDPTEKTLIFSQFTSLLDLVEVPLLKERFHYQRYDGSMTMDDRASAVEAFMDMNSNVNIMLVSLKAGNAGLNLWRASQVIMLDPFWNPFVEDQAVDRAHRMPQKREVFVHRVLVPETVEDRICLLQDNKREIIGQALDEQASKSLTRLDVRQLKYLFGLG